MMFDKVVCRAREAASPATPDIVRAVKYEESPDTVETTPTPANRTITLIRSLMDDSVCLDAPARRAMRVMNLVRSDPTTTIMPRDTASSARVVTRDALPAAPVVVVELVLVI